MGMGAVLPYLRIILFSIGCAVLYGIIHDQVTAHVCVEYFTVAHISLLGIRDPTVLGVAWGIIATWWVGLELGVLLALVARVGSRPKLAVRDVRRPILLLMLGVGLTSVLAGLVGYALARMGDASIPYYYVTDVPPARQALFIADAWAHGNAYTVGAVGGLLICLWALRRRGYAERDGIVSRWGQAAWRLVERTWDTAARANALARVLTILALAVLVLGTYALCGSWFTAAGDLEPPYFALALGWPIVLLVFWVIGTAALFAARQPRAVGIFLALCLVLGVVVAAVLFTLAFSTGASVVETFLALDLAVIYAAWRLMLRPSITTPPHP